MVEAINLGKLSGYVLNGAIETGRMDVRQSPYRQMPPMCVSNDMNDVPGGLVYKMRVFPCRDRFHVERVSLLTRYVLLRSREY